MIPYIIEIFKNQTVVVIFSIASPLVNSIFHKKNTNISFKNICTLIKLNILFIKVPFI
jgi:hypothetical protein